MHSQQQVGSEAPPQLPQSPSRTSVRPPACPPQLILPQAQYGSVLRQLRRDLDLLERMHVIDYSLLLGVHFARW